MNIVIIDVKIKESQYYFNPQVSIQAKITIKWDEEHWSSFILSAQGTTIIKTTSSIPTVPVVIKWQ